MHAMGVAFAESVWDTPGLSIGDQSQRSGGLLDDFTLGIRSECRGQTRVLWNSHGNGGAFVTMTGKVKDKSV